MRQDIPLFRPFGALLLVTLLAIPGTPSCLSADSPAASTFLDRTKNGTFDLRVMSWNVWLDSIFPPGGIRRDSFERIVKAVQPDLICLQEIDPRSAGQLPGMLDRLLPLENGLHWQVHFATNGDNVIASRYPLVRRAQEAVIPRPIVDLKLADFHLGQVMSLVDLPDSLNVPDVYVIVTHFMASGTAGIQARQRHSDSIVRWLRRLRDANDSISLPAGTPIAILGDLNVFVGEPKDAAHHLTTLLTGNIRDEATFGPDIKPDWDDSDMIEVKPRHNVREKDFYTWRFDGGKFAPGPLDRIIYSDSVMTVRKSFVLNTTTMSAEELNRSGLLETDVLKGGKAGDFDHLPLVVDFVPLAGNAVQARKAE